MIPTYDQERYLPTAIESALAQNYRPLEVLVIDDASPDGTKQVVERYQDEPNFRYVRNDRNLGRVANYHRGLYELASGDYVLNLDGDDWLADPTYISVAMDVISKNPDLLLVFASAGTFDEAAGVVEGSPPDPGPAVIFRGTTLLDGYAEGTVGIPHLTAVYLRDAARRVGFYSHDIIGSDTLSMLMLSSAGPAAYVPCRAAIWRQHGRNASVGTHWRPALENFAVTLVPARHFVATGLMSATEATGWHRRASTTLAHQQITQYLSSGRVDWAAMYLLGLTAALPGTSLGLLLRLAESMLEPLRRKLAACRRGSITAHEAPR